jgi:hypothetical protein
VVRRIHFWEQRSVQLVEFSMMALLGHLSASVFMMGGGPEAWHPNPGFFYAHGGGPVSEVCGKGSRIFQSRLIGSGPLQGDLIPVEIDTYMQAKRCTRIGCLQF